MNKSLKIFRLQQTVLMKSLYTFCYYIYNYFFYCLTNT